MKLLWLLSSLGLLAACAGSARPYRTAALPPPTRVDPVTDLIHGAAIADEYRWLEGDNTDPADRGKVTPEVAGWTDAQNQYTREVLDNLPGRAASKPGCGPSWRSGR